MNTLTKKIRKQIKDIAAKLPVKGNGIKNNVYLSGAEILAKNPNAKLKGGEAVKLGGWYSIEQEIPAENHEKRMQSAYQKGGKMAVEAYVQSIIDREENKKPKNEAVSI